MKLLTKTKCPYFPGQEAGMKSDLYTVINGLEWQRFFSFCRPNLYQIGLVDFLVLVYNIQFPNFKEEINV